MSDKDIVIGIQINYDPYTAYLWQTVSITEWALYGPYEFIAPVTDYTTTRFLLNLAGNDVDIYFDDVRMIDLNHMDVKSRDPGTTAVEAFKLEQNFPILLTPVPASTTM